MRLRRGHPHLRLGGVPPKWRERADWLRLDTDALVRGAIIGALGPLLYAGLLHLILSKTLRELLHRRYLLPRSHVAVKDFAEKSKCIMMLRPVYAAIERVKLGDGEIFWTARRIAVKRPGTRSLVTV